MVLIVLAVLTAWIPGITFFTMYNDDTSTDNDSVSTGTITGDMTLPSLRHIMCRNWHDYGIIYRAEIGIFEGMTDKQTAFQEQLGLDSGGLVIWFSQISPSLPEAFWERRLIKGVPNFLTVFLFSFGWIVKDLKLEEASLRLTPVVSGCPPLWVSPLYVPWGIPSGIPVSHNATIDRKI